ncbi:hypothetical protein EZV62_014815 [Acer yangbiense]|uniref:Uncharacterized protein n=1 Tax=Acer yangbiense TaxID=1000413 RepID=A0A5C7HVM1_9ROSI|nr:hypothetical protein EZV62_014815 [Acer yangbiense]
MRKHNLIRNLKGESWRRWICSEPPRKRFAALWGNGDYGRLGLSSLESQWSPSLIYNPPPLTETGRVYATGLNDFGQLGIQKNTSYALDPLEVSGLGKEILQISAGYHHSSAITG